jgi:hypothetical protein
MGRLRCLLQLITCAILLSYHPSETVWAFPNGYPNYSWANYDITFNLPGPSWGAPGTPRFEAAHRGILSWDQANVPGSRLSLSAFEQVTASPDSVFDFHNTLAIVDSIAPGIAAITSRRGTTALPYVWLETDMKIVTDSPPPVDFFGFHWANSAAASDSLPDSFSRKYVRVNLEGIVRHEMGHAIGLSGPTSATSHEYQVTRLAVMNQEYSYGGMESSLMHGDDRNGLRTYYSAPGPAP